MNDTKSLFLSRTFWGGVILVLSIGLRLFDVELTAEEQSAATDVIVKAVDGAVALIGFVLVVYGRIKATKSVKVVSKK